MVTRDKGTVYREAWSQGIINCVHYDPLKQGVRVRERLSSNVCLVIGSMGTSDSASKSDCNLCPMNFKGKFTHQCTIHVEKKEVTGDFFGPRISSDSALDSRDMD